MPQKKEEKTSKPQIKNEIETLVEKEKIVKRLDASTLEINADKYRINTDYRNALDLELLEERYSDLLEKYDFIVGDMSYGKLRLRGFYQNSNSKAPIDMKIAHLEDYLTEYCSFGCAYFVLESLETKNKNRTYPDSDVNYEKTTRKPQQKKQDKGRRRPSKRKGNTTGRQRSSEERQAKPKQGKKAGSSQSRKKESRNKSTSDSKTRGKETKSFTKKSRSGSRNQTESTEKVKEVKNEQGNTRFQIRKKSGYQKGEKDGR
ncbi:Hypothetical DUF1027 domain protein [Alkalibacterium sp. AK22]|uniref:YutD family protein n=1 Tax=Alkalibacterium sp. AK22 TaxID=1229520 RepID=UPI00044BEF05|nr:YutD family protein [Alkalibacterium sp. AK22]EXJ22924.1 Hypothetical DUF1027 domain protein [Alkalibacterium sp. AK22]